MNGFRVLVYLLCGLQWFRDKGVDESNIDSNSVREYIKKGGRHPAELFPHCFSRKKPDAAITYEWSLKLQEMLSFLNRSQMIRCSIKYSKMIPFDMDQLFIWIDVFFVNQLSNDIIAALELSDRVYATSRFHLALGTETLLTRCWCLSEYAVRFGAGKVTLVLVSDIPGQRFNLDAYLKRTSGKYYEEMEATYDSDKEKIRGKIDVEFPTPSYFNSVIKSIVSKATTKFEAKPEQVPPCIHKSSQLLGLHFIELTNL